MIVPIFRVLSILCGLFFLMTGWIWQYLMALFVLPVGIAGMILWFSANRMAKKLPDENESSARWLNQAAWWINITAFLSSGVALLYNLVAVR